MARYLSIVNVLDLALLAFVAAGALGGLGAGFVKAAATLAGLVLGFVLGSALVPSIAPFLLHWMGEIAMASLVGFTVVALVAVLLFESVGTAATAAVQRLHLQVLNRPLGLLPAIASTVLIAGVTLALLNGFSLLERQREESRLSPWILQVSAPLVDLLPPPWNGTPRPLPPQPIPAPDAPAMARR